MKKYVSAKITILCLVVLLLFSNGLSLSAQDLNAYQKKVFTTKTDTLPYRILLPKNYNPNIAYPFVLFLHGMGEKGNDNEKQLIHGAKLFLTDSIRDKYPAIVVFPQCPMQYYWPYDNILFPDKVLFLEAQELLKGLIAQLKKEYRLDEKRFYAGGLSMGGMGIFELINQNPEMFAAVFPICGGANPAIANRIKQPSWWIFHGEIDDVVPVEYSKQMYTALKAVNADVNITLYPNIKHNSWENALREPELIPWLFSKSLEVNYERK